MTARTPAPPPNDSERAVVDRFEAAPYADEAWVMRREAAYQEGRWCGECRYGVVEDPPCCTSPVTASDSPAVEQRPGDPAQRGHFERGDRGRCGNAAPTFIGGPPELCVLLAGHDGWHRSDQGGEWNDPSPTSPTADVLIELLHERRRQTAKHGDQSHLPDGTGPDLILTEMPVHTRAARADHLERWARERTKAASQNEGGDSPITFEHILTEEWGEVIAEADPARLRAELVQVAAVAVQWIEAIDARGGAR